MILLQYFFSVSCDKNGGLVLGVPRYDLETTIPIIRGMVSLSEVRVEIP